MTVAEQLYRAIKMLPCRCEYHWQEGKADRMLTRKCAAHIAMERFEREGDKAHDALKWSLNTGACVSVLGFERPDGTALAIPAELDSIMLNEIAASIRQQRI